VKSLLFFPAHTEINRSLIVCRKKFYAGQTHRSQAPENMLQLVRFHVTREAVMNIQIFGTGKCFETKKAQRWFKERRIPFQFIDLKKYGISRGELQSVKQAVGLQALMNTGHPDAVLLEYLAYEEDKLERLLEHPALLRTPIVRNGRQATVGDGSQVWRHWL